MGDRIDVDSTQNIISFCTGYGGIESGIRRAGVDVRTVCNVEIEAFVQANLVAKIEEGRMDNAPIYSDLKTFPAEIFRGKVHGITCGYPCQPFSRRGSEKEKKTQGTYGHTSEDTSGQLDLPGFLPKMSEATPRWGYGESCPIWKKMVTERSGDCSQRRKQARLTNASECSSWPTATARDHKGCYKTLVRKDGKPRGDLLPDAVNIAEQNWPTPRETMSRDATYDRGKCNLGEVVHNPQNWPTPRAGNPGSRKPGTGGKILAEEAKKNWATPQGTDGDRINQVRKRSELSEKAKKGGCRNLREDVQNWATPNTMDYMETRSAEGVEKIASGARKGRKRPSNLREQVDKKTCDIYAKHNGPPAPEKSSTSGKNHGSPKLNPNWVEQLMGLPIGWTDLGSWGTESSHKPQN